jgi:hypothetical protein
LWNSAGRLSPKNTMSGFMIARSVSAGHLGHLGITWKSKELSTQDTSGSIWVVQETY